ncbi:MAG: hypothetical protein U0997_01400, partial [Sulfurimicrobium sp.]|nr:hypothetical protein [Sulfurimicrobium sp.]
VFYRHVAEHAKLFVRISAHHKLQPVDLMPVLYHLHNIDGVFQQTAKRKLIGNGLSVSNGRVPSIGPAHPEGASDWKLRNVYESG